MVPIKSKIMAARMVHMPAPNTAWLPLESLEPLTWFLMIPKRVKSHARTMTVTTQATSAVAAANMAPQKPAPRARRKAMNARTQATGWRTMTRVSALVVFLDAVLKSVWSISAMISAGL